MESSDIGVEQTSSSPAGSSLSLAGTGTTYSDFSWESTDSNSKGSLNANQSFGQSDNTDAPAVVEFSTDKIAVFENEGEVQVEVNITNYNAETSTTVDVTYAGGTAGEEDFEAFNTTTLTFPAGSDAAQSFLISISDDDEYERNETILMALENVKEAEIGNTDTLRLVIRNNDGPQLGYLDYWINEFHYQNAGPDSSEFVEIARELGVVAKSNAIQEDEVVLTLYNGTGGRSYASFSGDDIAESENSPSGYQLFSVNTEGIQNGDPDGLSLSVDGEIVQFISYGETFTAIDGPAQDYESIDVGVTEPESTSANTSIGLTGTGESYHDFTWAVSDSSTKGFENAGQLFLDPVVSNEESPAVADRFQLHQNYPNPFNPTTNISYDLKNAGAISLVIYNVIGRKVATLVDENKTAGLHSVTFDASGLSSGIYFYQLIAGGQTFTQKMLLSK